jgi:epoxyqueuosine reductase
VLICGEVKLRQELGQAPTIDEYQKRFPEFAGDIALQFSLHRILGKQGDEGEGESGVGNDILEPELAGYVFLGEIITDAVLPTVIHTPGECLHCGACRKACPVGLNKDRCLSALTQKKGTLSPDELALLHNHPLIWGCDTCQEACPYTKAAIKRGTLYRAPSFFRRDVLPLLNEEILTGMDENSFAQRAYAWRGRAVIERNLKLKKDP